ncbi:hypothetical protein [Agaribacterium sp. ZY112]|uniref:hypothetical protein n=1 Tax=Agaribacterium sp. ZY112 TaxID=3233574 RepID=UPI0035235279
MFSRIFLSIAILFSFSACKLGFEENENPKDKSEYSGPSEGAWWLLSFSGDTNGYDLKKYSSASSSIVVYTVSGQFERLDNGFVRFNVSTSTDNAGIGEFIGGIELGENAFVLYPFESGADELIPLVEKADCPSSDINGTGLFMENTADASSTSVRWVGPFLYSISGKTANLTKGFALDDAFTKSDAENINSATCSDGISLNTGGDHFFASDSAIVEVGKNGNNYRRLFSLPSRILNAINSADGNYAGLLKDFGSPSDETYALAECTNGACEIYKINGIEGSKGNSSYTLRFNQELNHDDVPGLITGTLTDNQTTPIGQAGNVLCSVNSALSNGNSSKQLLHCNAQSPTTNSSLLNMIFIEQ